MRKTVIYLFALSLLVLAAVPVYAGNKETSKSQHFEVDTDAGQVRASWGQWGDDLLVASWSGPYWFRCVSYGFDREMPTMSQKGNDTVVASGSFEASDFDFCWGFPEENDLSFEIEIVADTVTLSQSLSKYKQTIIKGDDYGMEHFYSSHTLAGNEVTASGVMFGSAIGSTYYGEFQFSTDVFD